MNKMTVRRALLASTGLILMSVGPVLAQECAERLDRIETQAVEAEMSAERRADTDKMIEIATKLQENGSEDECMQVVAEIEMLHDQSSGAMAAMGTDVQPKPAGTAEQEAGTETATMAQQEEEADQTTQMAEGSEDEAADEGVDVEPKPEGTAETEEATETETTAQEEEEAGSDAEMSADSESEAESTGVEAKPQGTAETEAGTETESMAQQEESLGAMPAGDLVGKEVVNAGGEEVGSIEDVVRDEDQAYAIVSVGGFLGVSDKNVAVPLDELAVGEEDVILMSEASEEELEGMEEYEDGLYESVPGDEPANPMMGE